MTAGIGAQYRPVWIGRPAGRTDCALPHGLVNDIPDPRLGAIANRSLLRACVPAASSRGAATGVSGAVSTSLQSVRWYQRFGRSQNTQHEAANGVRAGARELRQLEHRAYPARAGALEVAIEDRAMSSG